MENGRVREPKIHIPTSWPVQTSQGKPGRRRWWPSKAPLFRLFSKPPPRMMMLIVKSVTQQNLWSDFPAGFFTGSPQMQRQRQHRLCQQKARKEDARPNFFTREWLQRQLKRSRQRKATLCLLHQPLLCKQARRQQQRFHTVIKGASGALMAPSFFFFFPPETAFVFCTCTSCVSRRV